MKTSLFERKMNEIVQNIRNAGYDPRDQLTGYIQTGDASFITRNGNARQEIQELDMERVKLFFQKHFHNFL